MRNKIKNPTKREEWIIKIMILLGLFSIVNFLFFFLQPEHRGNNLLYILLCIALFYSILKKLYMWYNYANISVPTIPASKTDFSVDILTTYFPGEPYQMIVTTLEAITQITYPHTAYLCDEANDPFLKNFCEENGIVHVTRNNRKDAKAGNINNALNTVAKGEICVVLDPDHIPEPHFLDDILPFFADTKIGFVQIVQSYYNIKDTLVARGAAEQTFQFYGPMMMTLHSYGTVNAIGANCVFRRKALDSIGGHAPGLCEDMHTAMLLYSKGWKSIYLPEVLAKGLAPSNLTTYFKQQLKWARGSFDLLFKVYPKVFKNLTVRQKIHFGILPLHYLSGIIYFINFLIPILSLILSTTPWRGNIIDFFLTLLPLSFSAMLIRAFVQKWVIDKEERGFHITGGLLQINTWWIYILGFLYTIVNKKVPYLPTPKESEFNTNLKIVIPNTVIALISLFAIIYGLQKDLTPFSIFMAGFALFNSCIMFFGIYLAVKVTNQNRILRSNLSDRRIKTLFSFKRHLRTLFHSAFTFSRKGALLLLGLIIITAISFKETKESRRWNNIKPSFYSKQSGRYLGIFHPPEDSGLTDMDAIDSMESKNSLDFDIISFYFAWNEENTKSFPFDLLESVASKNAIPLISWEPWTGDMALSKGNPELENNKKVFSYISSGFFDEYITGFADRLAQFNRPVFLRFAHEFDNPQYPWSAKGGNSNEDFIAAWKHVHNILRSRGADKVMMVWNPWSSEHMESFYPGNKYVDWIGITALNYQQLNQSGKDVSFKELYNPYHEKMSEFTRKPVMLSEFGSLNNNRKQNKWFKKAATALEEDFNEVKAVVLFHSAFDNNIPSNRLYHKDYLDWTLDSINVIKEVFDSPSIISSNEPAKLSEKVNRRFLDNIRGVRYKKGEDWQNNYYVLTRDRLLEDLKKIREANINTIQFKGGNIYEYNFLKYTQAFDLNVIYEFRIDLSEGFISNPEYLQKRKKEIIEKVKSLKSHINIKAYTFSFNLSTFYNKPLLFKQKEAYAAWLQPIIQEIKTIDPYNAVLLDLPLEASTLKDLVYLDNLLAVDSYGLILNDTLYLKEYLKETKFRNIPVHFSSVPSRLLTKKEFVKSSFVVVENWQDERLSYRLSFDGLVGFSGQKKRSYFQVAETFGRNAKSYGYKPSILKPATALIPGERLEYSAALFKDGKWYSGNILNNDLSFEWWLIKNDDFGNPLAAKKIGQKAVAMVEIPEDYENYELLMTVAKNGTDRISQSRTTLHTPLYRPLSEK